MDPFQLRTETRHLLLRFFLAEDGQDDAELRNDKALTMAGSIILK